LAGYGGCIAVRLTGGESESAAIVDKSVDSPDKLLLTGIIKFTVI
jgi:hypothetical protein